ncbi:MAG: class I SAM-dependent methyltransferase [Methylotetracoccus sp.]
MTGSHGETAEPTAERVALWRALHVEVDIAPHVLVDTLGLQLIEPEDDWRRRPDMHPQRTSRARASIVARARFIEDLVVEEADRGIGQYVLLGAGLDSFAQRHPDIGSRMRLFEVDQPGPQAWKQRRLVELGLDLPDWLHFVPVDFARGESWFDRLLGAGFDASRPAVIGSLGVAMYLSRDVNSALLRAVASLAGSSTLVMSFQLPLELVDEEERAGRQATEKFARAQGTPFLSMFSPGEMLDLARDAGFRECRHVSSAELREMYFAERIDGLRPSSAEELIVARTSQG